MTRARPCRRSVPAWLTLALVALLAAACNTSGAHRHAHPHRPSASSAPAPAPFKVAVLEFNPVLGDKAGNQDRLAHDIDSALARGARLVVTPEMSNTGYAFRERTQIAPLVEPIPGPWTRRLTRLAAAHNGYIATSLPEVDPATGLYYISAVLVGPAGVVGVYRKNHLWQQEELWAARGDVGIPVFKTPLGRIAFNICMDTVFWEPARVAAVEGADILIVPTNSSGQTVSLFQELAAQNGIYVIGANRAGNEGDFHMVGLSGVWSPAGRALALSGFVPAAVTAPPRRTREVWATVDPLRARARRAQVMAERRPALYALTAAYAPLHPHTAPAPGRVTALALQLEPSPGQVRDNLAALTDDLDRLAPPRRHRPGPVLAVTPELALTGPVTPAALGPAGLARLADQAARTEPALARLARRHRVYLVVGTLRRTASGRVADAALVFTPDGTLAGAYARSHLDRAQRGWLAAGASTGLFDLPGLGRLGILLGDEARVPELIGQLEVRRADLIAVPSAIRDDRIRQVSMPGGFAGGAYAGEVPLSWDAVARFGQAYVVGANYAGDGFAGHSGVVGIDPIYGLDQPHLAGPSGPGIAARIDLARESSWWFNQATLILLRRPELYRALLSRNAATPPARRR